MRLLANKEFTLDQFVKLVLKGKFSISTPIITEEGILYEVGDDLDEDDVEKYERNLMKNFEALKLKSGSNLYIEDLNTDF